VIYSQIFLKQQPKIPVILTLIIILVTIIFLAKIFGTKPQPSSANSAKVKSLSIVNLSYNQAGIFWQTEEKSVDWLVFGDSKGNVSNIVLDDRDIPDRKTAVLNHLVTLKDLKENRTYYFKLVSNNKLIGDPQNQPFSFKTSSSLTSTTNLSPAYGKILNKNGTPLEGAAVFLTFDGAYPLLTFTKSVGDWLIPINNILDRTTLKIKSISKAEKIKIEIVSEDGEKSTIMSDLISASPLPQTIIIGKNYSFSSQNNVLSATSEVASGLAASGKKVEILFPMEGAVIPGVNPLIKGSALPGSDVVVTVHSDVSYSFRVKADNDGIWRVGLSARLDPGEHTVTVVSKDATGQTVTLSRKFMIAKSGEQVMGLATGEATPTIIPTSILTPFATGSATTAPAPSSGSNPLPIFVVSGSFIIVGLGLLLAF